MSAPKAYAYLRFSSKPQERGDSVRRQTSEAERYAKAHGLELDTEFRLADLGVSGFRGKNLDPKAGLGMFLDAVKRGDIAPGSYFLFEHADRLSRMPPLDALEVALPLLRAGIILVATKTDRVISRETLNEDVSVFITWWVEMQAAHGYSKKLGERMASVWADKKARMREGEVSTRMLPFWLRSQKVSDRKRGPIELHPVYAPVVQRIFREYLKGRGKAQIAKGLTADGIPTPETARGLSDAELQALIRTAKAPDPKDASKFWRAAVVGAVLANQSVTGTFQPRNRLREPDGDPIPGYYPRVISDADFAAVAAIRERNRAVKGERLAVGKSEVVHILARLATCPKCGAHMGRLNSGHSLPRYVCSAAVSGKSGTCERVYVRVSDVEAALVAAADRLGSTAPGGDPSVTARVQELEAALADLAPKLARVEAVIDAIGEGFEAALPVQARLEKERDNFTRELTALRGKAMAAQPGVIKSRVASMVAALKGYGPGPLDFNAPAVNATLIECFSKVVIDYQESVLRLHWRHGPPPAVVPYSDGAAAMRAKRGR